jgi:hypothetical protein
MKRPLLVLLVALCGCGTNYFPTRQEQLISLRKGDLEASGIAFITPSTVTGQEQEKQAVALTFADVLKRERPALRVTTLAETLGAVNRAGLADAYKRMYDDYRDTGLFSGEVLQRVGAATGARYIAQLKLQGFTQSSKNRLGLLGFRLIETQIGDVRLFFQIWDTSNGTIAWEGMQELRISLDSITDEPVMMRALLERTAQDLIATLP